MSGLLFQVRSADDVIQLVEDVGFLPFFANCIHGFSLEECCPRELWFAEGVDGPWEWKGPVVRSGRCVYGKFYGGKAGFVSRAWFPDFANFRRDGYDFDSRYDDGLASRKDKGVFDTVSEHGALLSKELKDICNYRKGGNKGFDTVITRLQMQTYICIADFVYMKDKYGQPYGWGVAKYAMPEAELGYDFTTSAYHRKPEESRERIIAHLKTVLPETDIEKLASLIKWGGEEEYMKNRKHDTDEMVYNSDLFEEYSRETDPSKRERSYAWHTAIGLQVADGLEISDY